MRQRENLLACFLCVCVCLRVFALAHMSVCVWCVLAYLYINNHGDPSNKLLCDALFLSSIAFTM